jgi:hypothetical protein
MGEVYMKAHAALDIGVAERIDLDGLPYKVNETGGAKVEIVRATPERVDVLPAGVRSVTPEIINPVYHGTPYHEKFPSFVDDEGNLVLYPSDNFDGAQVGVSFGKNRAASARYAGGDVSIRDFNPNIGMIFEIDESALPNNVIDFDEREIFAPADPDAVDTISAIQAEIRGGVEGVSLEELRPFATIIPAGKWRVTPATETSPFVPPKDYVGLRPEETVTVPAKEGSINLNTPELINDYQNLPKGTFNSVNEWINYNVNKAQNELAIPRIANESDIDFDARISKMSLDETRAGRVPLNPGGTFLNRMTLLGSLHADAADLFGDDNFMMNIYQQVLGDFGTNAIGVQHGRAAVDSVFMRSERAKIKINLASSQSIHASYASYMAGVDVPVNKYRNIVTNFVANSWFIGNSKREGKVDMPTFRSMISVIAENPNNTHFNGMEIPQEVHTAARGHRQVYDYFEEKIRQYGLSDMARILDYDIESLKRRESAAQDAIRRSPKRSVPSLQATLNGLQEDLRIATLAKENLKAIPLLPRGVDNYVNHVWRIDQVEARREEFTKKITTLFERDQFEGAEDRAKRWVSHLLGETDEDVLSPGGSGGGVMYIGHRQINATFEEFGDFLETDIQLLMQHYVNKMVPAIEMHRMFGDRTMKRKIDEMRTHLAIKYADLPEKQRLKKIGDQIQLIEDARDRVLGTFGVNSASQWSLRGVRALKNVSVLNHMGSAVVAAITDPSRMMMRAGMGDTMRYALAHFDAGAEGLAMSKQMAKLAGQAGEFASWGTNARFQHGDSLIRANGTMVERGLDMAVPYFFMGSGLTPWTIWMKEFTGGLAAHVIISDIQKIAKAVESGKPVDQKILKRMLAQGINERDAVIISKMPIETYGPHKLKLANVKAWRGTDGDYAREKFLAALQGEIQTSIMTASPGDKARIFDGVVYKSKARYKVEKQISDLETQRSEVLEKIRAIRSDASIPDSIMPSLLGDKPDLAELAVRQDRAREISNGFYGRNAVQAAEWLMGNTKPEYVPVATKVVERLQMLERAGMKTSVTILERGSPNVLGKATAHAEVKFGRTTGTTGGISVTDPEVNVVYRGLTDDTTTKKMPPLSDEIALHELIHAAIHGSIKLAREGSTFETAPKLSQAYMELAQLRFRIVERHKKRVAKAKKGGLTLLPIEERFSKWNTLDNEDEFVAWGMTSREFQEYLEGIPSPSGLKTMFDDFVNLVRDMLGFAPGQETSLSKLIQITGDLLDVDATELRALGNARRTRMVAEYPTAAEKAFQPDISMPTPTQQPLTGTSKDLGDVTQRVSEGDPAIPRPRFLDALLAELEAKNSTAGDQAPQDIPTVTETLFNPEDAAAPTPEPTLPSLNLDRPSAQKATDIVLTKDEMIAPLLEQLSEIGKQSGILKNSAPRVGRGGSPLLGLPFQFMSFAVAAGPKLLGSMLNDRDRSRAMGALTMLSTGYLISRFWDNDADRWDDMSLDQKFYKAFDRSGLGGIISTMGATADTFDVGLGAALDWTQPYGPAKFSEKVGRIAGAGPGDVVSFAQALLDPDLSIKERASMIRRVTPGNNLFYLKGLFKSVGNALAEFVEEDGTNTTPAQFRGDSEPRPRRFD